jgi:hypothetical protein
MGKGTIRLKGKMSGVDFVREIPVDFSKSESQNGVLSTLWARTRVDDLMSQDFKGAQQGAMKDDVKEAVIQLGLDYRLMTQFTSFVAVEEMIVTDGGQPRRIDVPVEVPEGVNRAAVYPRQMPVNGRGYANFAMLSSGVVNSTASSTVTVTAAAETINRQSATDVITVYKAEPPPTYGGNAPKPKAKRPGSKGSGRGDGASEGEVSSPAEQKRAQLQSKFHPSVLAVIDRLLDSKLGPAADEARFIHNGKAEIQIWLTDKSDETMAKLKELGFEVVLDPKTAKLVIGRLSIDKLAALAELKSVRYVAPQLVGN